MHGSTTRKVFRLSLSLILLCGWFWAVQAACPISTASNLETVASITDGDTLVLADGARVRLAGLDTTELGHNKGPDAPWSVEAKILLERIVHTSNGQVRVELAQESQDHYGRLIAHLYTDSGSSVQEHILNAGLAFGYARPPNLEHLDCYRAAEEQARKQNLGLWSTPPKSATNLEVWAKGFTRIQGVVTGVDRTNKSIWIKLGERFSLRVAQEDMAYFNTIDFDHLSKRILDVRGYLYTYRGHLQMRMRHPADMRIVD